MRTFAWCLGLVGLCVIWFTPEGEWILTPMFMVFPWLHERRKVRRQMDRELAAIFAFPHD